MHGREQQSRRKDMVWGGIFIGLGFLLLVGQFDIDVSSVWRWWPLILIVSGVVKIVVPGQRIEIGSGVLEVLAGAWFLAVFQKWYDIEFQNTWPVLLVFFGLKTVIDALAQRSKRSADKEASNA